MVLGGVACVGNETRLVDCQSAAIPSCSHSDDAGVLCKAECKMKCNLRGIPFSTQVVYNNHSTIRITSCKIIINMSVDVSFKISLSSEVTHAQTMIKCLQVISWCR